MGTRWIIAGSQGQLGRALSRALALRPEYEVAAAVDLPEVDIADPGAVQRLLACGGAPPDVVVNAAAFTHVDRCETERDVAERANAVGPQVLAEACAAAGCRLAHVSTDYVFRGDASEPYREDDEPDPVSAYGATKLAGERAVRSALPDALVVRTSWVFGEGRNFIGAILDQAVARREGRASGPLRVVDDQLGRPTYAEDLAAALVALLERDARGLYHVANAGVASWWDLARECLDRAGFADIGIDRIGTGELDVPAPRPRWSVLDCSKAEALGVRLRSWQEAAATYLASEFSPLAAREVPR
jgi:dTDP-4-dehydrorhamnose reductase